AIRYIPSMVFNMLFHVFAPEIEDDENIVKIEVLPMVQSEPTRYMGPVPPPVKPVEIAPDAWRNMPWYLGGSLFWAPRLYTTDKRVSGNFANIGMSFTAEYYWINFASEDMDFLKYLSISSGLEFAPDWIIATSDIGDEYRNVILQIPLLFNYVLKPGETYMHKPYVGIVFNIPLFPDTTPPLISGKAGFQYGRKAGPGIAFADASFSVDFGKSGLDKRTDDPRQYHRIMLYFGAGYKWGLGKPGVLPREEKEKPVKEKKEKVRKEPEPAAELDETDPDAEPEETELTEDL
ncbi:MAG: hypothetical protein FWD36_04580, partial [Treponema sp.]|nr:hypothetical protein [Treponema sp.]